jgi:hypothetical protein
LAQATDRGGTALEPNPAVEAHNISTACGRRPRRPLSLFRDERATMTTLRTAVKAAALMATLAACGDSPTAGTTTDAVAPSYDGGFGMGSGNREAPADSAMGVAADTTPRGGYTMGSGN